MSAAVRSSSSPSQIQHAAASDDDEMLRFMRSSSEEPDHGDNHEITPATLNSQRESSVFNNLDSELPSGSQRSSSQAPVNTVALLTSASNLRMVLVKARRQAERLKLHPYQVETVETFARSSSFDREIQLFTQLLAVSNKLTENAVAAPPFTVSPGLMTNIKSYVFAVLLSSRLSAYRGTTARDHIFSIIARERAHVPVNFDKDADTKKTILTTISNELTQARARIKKDIKASLAESESDDLTQSQHILDLAASVVANTEVSVTVPLCARLSILRSRYRKNSGEKVYWNSVDAVLAALRKEAGTDTHKLQRTIQRLLKEDRDKYGDKMQYTLPDASITGSTWQRSVEDIFQVAS